MSRAAYGCRWRLVGKRAGRLAVPLATLLALTAAPAQPATRCDADTLRIAPLGARDFGAVGLVPIANPMAAVAFLSARQVTGPCAAAITAANGNQFYLRDGRVLDLLSDGTVRPRSDNGIGFAGSDAAATAPGIGALKPVQTLEIYGGSRSRRTVYVGLWSDRRTATVAMLVKDADTFARPIPVLTSRTPITALGYFPSPDTMAGGLTLLQPGGAGLRLISTRLDTDLKRLDQKVR